MHTYQASGVRRISVATALAIGSIALLTLGLQPILLGDLVDTQTVSLEGVGLVAMSEIIAVGLGVVIGDICLNVARLPGITAICAILIASFDGLTTVLTGDLPLAAIRAAAGLSEGVLVWVTTSIIVRSIKPDRLAGIFLVLQTLAQATLAAIFARSFGSRPDWQAGFHVLALIALAPCVLAWWLPRGLVPLAVNENQRASLSFRSTIPLIVAFLQMAAVGSIWAYLEPIAEHVGLSAAMAKTAISGVLLTQILGGMLAALLVRRLGVISTLAFGSAVLAIVAVGFRLTPHSGVTPFLTLCGIFGFAWLFLMTFHVGFALRVDKSGRVATLIPASQLIGVAIGPLVASLTVGDNNPELVPLVSLGFAALATLLTIGARVFYTGASTLSSKTLDGKVVLVAGASSGMGRTFALRVAAEGATVVATARRQDRLDSLAAEIERLGSRSLVLAADALDTQAAQRVVDECIERFGRIDIALLNVGGAPALDMRKMSAGEVTAYMRSNYDTVVNYLFPILHVMTKQEYGLIAHTNSLAGFLGVPLQGPYSAAKGALRLLFDTCRIEFRSAGIRFVSIYPGFVATEKTAADGMPAPFEISESKAVDYMLSAILHERSDYLFPFTLRWLIRLAAWLPKPLVNWLLAHELEQAGTNSAGDTLIERS